VVEAAIEKEKPHPWPGIVLLPEDEVELAKLLLSGVGRSVDVNNEIGAWKIRVVREACDRNGINVGMLHDPKQSRDLRVARARAQAVRLLVRLVHYGEAARAVGIWNHSSVYYWVKGAGKDKYK